MPDNLSEVVFARRPSLATRAAEQDASILINRWAGAWIDFIVIAACFLLPDYLLGNELYRKTLMVWVALAALSFPVTEAAFGKTLGKFVTRIRVVGAPMAESRPCSRPSFARCSA